MSVHATAHLWGLASLPFVILGLLLRRWFTPAWVFLLMLIAGFFSIGANFFYFIDDYQHGRPAGMAIDAFLIAVWVWIIWSEWKNWKNDRKRLLALLGAKSRALLERLTRKMADERAGA